MWIVVINSTAISFSDELLMQGLLSYRTVAKFQVHLRSFLCKCRGDDGGCWGQKLSSIADGGGEQSSRLTFTILVTLLVHAHHTKRHELTIYKRFLTGRELC